MSKGIEMLIFTNMRPLNWNTRIIVYSEYNIVKHANININNKIL
jgi:hypothetical protein